jgi:MFS family permease
MAGHILQFFFGDLADKIGSPKLIIGGTFVMSLTILATPLLAQNYYALLGLFFVYGVGAAAWNVSGNNWISSIGEKEGKEGTVLGSYISIAKFGEGASYIVSSIVVAFFGYSGVFFVLGTIGLIGVIAAAHLFIHLHLQEK